MCLIWQWNCSKNKRKKKTIFKLSRYAYNDTDYIILLFFLFLNNSINTIMCYAQRLVNRVTVKMRAHNILILCIYRVFWRYGKILHGFIDDRKRDIENHSAQSSHFDPICNFLKMVVEVLENAKRSKKKIVLRL